MPMSIQSFLKEVASKESPISYSNLEIPRDIYV